MNNLTLKEEVIEKWTKGQSIARIQKEMMITINLFDKSLAKLNDAILKWRFEVLGMNVERPSDLLKINKNEEIAELQNKLHRRNIQIKELKKKRIEAGYIENLLHQWQATEKMDFNCNAGRRDLALYLTEIINR